MKVFLSSTFIDLIEHRRAVADALHSVRTNFSAMEFFGSRPEEAREVCENEISDCDYFVGIYAWRYGWIPPGQATSITELEFQFAEGQHRRLLCYVVDPQHPWPVALCDTGRSRSKLDRFKAKVNKRVTAKFTSPDSLALHVVTDLLREARPRQPEATFGGFISANWHLFHPEVQGILLDTYRRAVVADEGVVSTRHMLASLVALPSSSALFMQMMPREALGEITAQQRPDQIADLPRAFDYDRPFSACVSNSLGRLLPSHHVSSPLLAIEVAVDLLKNGKGSSVAKFRRAGVDQTEVDRLLATSINISNNLGLMRDAMKDVTDTDLRLIAYRSEIDLPIELDGASLRETLLQSGVRLGRLRILAGEMLRYIPGLVHSPL